MVGRTDWRDRIEGWIGCIKGLDGSPIGGTDWIHGIEGTEWIIWIDQTDGLN
jgi:hypothetical protein